jgi:FG-GAP repeat/FG-GAP-like repeat
MAVHQYPPRARRLRVAVPALIVALLLCAPQLAAPPVSAAPPVPFAAAEPAADFNGDGFDDLAVGAPYEDNAYVVDSGAVTIFYGRSSGLRDAGQTILQPSPEAGDFFGSAIAAADFNGDGFDDLAVAAPGEDVGDVGVAGAVTVHYGSPTGIGSRVQLVLQPHPEGGDSFGMSLATGEFNGDSRYDLVVGAPFEDVNKVDDDAGMVTVHFGSANGISSGARFVLQPSPERGDHFGNSLAAGRFNADRWSDLAVGAWGEGVGDLIAAGAVTVHYGSANGFSSVRLVLSPTPEEVSGFGHALVAGDLTGDGRNDLVVSALYADAGNISAAGAVTIHRGSANGITSSVQKILSPSPWTGDWFGSALAIGHFNRDSRNDLAIGARNKLVNGRAVVGAVTIHFGRGTGVGAAAQQLLPPNPEASSGFGSALSVGRYNADVLVDLAVGASSQEVGNFLNAGAVDIHYGGWRPADGVKRVDVGSR